MSAVCVCERELVCGCVISFALPVQLECGVCVYGVCMVRVWCVCVCVCVCVGVCACKTCVDAGILPCRNSHGAIC